MFANPAGLMRTGENLWVESAASGTPNLVAGGASGAGTISSGYLEGSNVLGRRGNGSK